MCKTKGYSKQTVKYVISEEQNRDYAFVVNENSNTDRITSSVGGVNLFMLIDSGATSNIVDESKWEMLKAKEIRCRSSLTDKKGFSPVEATEGSTAHNSGWNRANGMAANHAYDVFDTIPPISLQPLP